MVRCRAIARRRSKTNMPTDYTDYSDFFYFFIICVNLCNLWAFFIAGKIRAILRFFLSQLYFGRKFILVEDMLSF